MCFTNDIREQEAKDSRISCLEFVREIQLWVSLKFVFIMIIIILRPILWITLIILFIGSIVYNNYEKVDIIVSSNPNIICTEYNHDCTGDSSSSCSNCLIRWDVTIPGKEGSFIINEKNKNCSTSSPPKYICKNNNNYSYPCYDRNYYVYLFFSILLIVVIIEIFYQGWHLRIKENCHNEYDFYRIIIISCFILLYTLILVSLTTITKASDKIIKVTGKKWNNLFY